MLSHVTSCAHDANGFLEVIAGLSETCGLSKRDVSQCTGPLDRVLLCLSSIQLSAAAGGCARCAFMRSAHCTTALGCAAEDDRAAPSSFILHDVCASIIAASPVLCSFCSLAPALVSHIDTMRVVPDVALYLGREDRCSRIQAAISRVLDVIGKVRVRCSCRTVSARARINQKQVV